MKSNNFFSELCNSIELICSTHIGLYPMMCEQNHKQTYRTSAFTIASVKLRASLSVYYSTKGLLAQYLASIKMV